MRRRPSIRTAFLAALVGGALAGMPAALHAQGSRPAEPPAAREPTRPEARPADRPAAPRDTTPIPKAMLPPTGKCRIWLDGVPAIRQPAPTDCRSALRQAPPNSRVIHGPPSPDDEEAFEAGRAGTRTFRSTNGSARRKPADTTVRRPERP